MGADRGAKATFQREGYSQISAQSRIATMQVLDRIEKKQRLREAEGYLELLAALGERNRPQLAMRRPIIERVLALLPVEADFGTRESRALFLRGQALRMIDEFALAIENLSLASGLEP